MSIMKNDEICINVQGDSSKLLEFVCYNGADEINVRNKAGIQHGNSDTSVHVYDQFYVERAQRVLS